MMKHNKEEISVTHVREYAQCTRCGEQVLEHYVLKIGKPCHKICVVCINRVKQAISVVVPEMNLREDKVPKKRRPNVNESKD